MELRNLRAFVAVAGMGSFREAAERLHYAQSTVSVQIRNLEQELDCTLFSRDTRRVELTPAGRRFLPHAHRLLEAAGAARAVLHPELQGNARLRIRMPQSLAQLFLPQLLKQLHDRFPRTDLDIASCEYSLLPAELAAGSCDLAFLLAPGLEFDDLAYECLGTLDLVLASAPQHALADRTRIKAADFNGQVLLLPKHDCSYRMLFEQMLRDEKLSPQASVELGSLEALIRCLTKGNGIALLPRLCITRELAARELLVLPWTHPMLKASVLMIYHQRLHSSPELEALMDLVRACFRQN